MQPFSLSPGRRITALEVKLCSDVQGAISYVHYYWSTLRLPDQTSRTLNSNIPFDKPEFLSLIF
jgi:hypothetical protein